MTTIEIKENKEIPEVEVSETVEVASTVAEQAHDQALETLAVASQIAEKMDDARKEGESVDKNLWEGVDLIIGELGKLREQHDEILGRIGTLESLLTVSVLNESDVPPTVEQAQESAAEAIDTASEAVETAAEVIQEPQERSKRSRSWL